MPSRRLHPSARTTRLQRRRIQASQDTDKACAHKMGLNAKTVAKWRRRTSVEDAPRGPKTRPRRALTDEDEVLAVALRQLTWAPLDVLLARLRPILPDLSRSALYRAWVRWGVSRTPRTVSPPAFPFARSEGKALSDGEPFQLRVFRIAPQDERAVFFMVGEQSGWICPAYGPKLEKKHGCEFLEMALSYLRETCATASVTRTDHALQRDVLRCAKSKQSSSPLPKILPPKQYRA